MQVNNRDTDSMDIDNAEAVLNNNPCSILANEEEEPTETNQKSWKKTKAQ